MDWVAYLLQLKEWGSPSSICKNFDLFNSLHYSFNKIFIYLRMTNIPLFEILNKNHNSKLIFGTLLSNQHPYAKKQ